MKNVFLSCAPLQSCSMSIVSLVLRLLVGGAMLTHGIPKLMSYATLSHNFPDPIGIGSQASLILDIGAEVGCSLLLIVGLFTRLAMLPLMFSMIVAIFLVHGPDTFAAKELAVLYMTIYIALFATGAGSLSVDRLIFKK